MNKLDDKIGEALSEDERRLIEQMPDYKNMFTLMAGSFRSKMRPFLILGLILGVLVTAFCVYSIVQVFQADTTKLQILWSLAATASFIWVGLAKVWMWMQLERQAVLMELKRSELRILSHLEQIGRAPSGTSRARQEAAPG